jgi:hypothetical protein
MALDRRASLSLCLGSFLVMLGAAFLMWARWEKVSNGLPPLKNASSADTPDSTMTAGTGWPTTPAKTPPAAPAAPAPTPLPGPRNIRFAYRDSRPSRVDLVGSFNNWTPVPLAKGENFIWSITLPLPPGEHTYNFLIDGKPVRDPNNPRTAAEGRSLLVVLPRQ